MRKALGALFLLGFFFILFAILVIHPSFGVPTASDPVVKDMMQDNYDQVAKDSVDQFNIAVRSGSRVDQCVHAGLVSAAYLQAKNEEQYKVWKKVEKSYCKAAGMPDM